MNFKKIFSLLLVILLNLTFTYGIQVHVPTQDGVESVSSSDGGGFISSMLKVLNKYLWFTIGVVAVLVIMWAGWELMSADGDEGKMKKANKVLVYVVLGIIISLFAYTFVRVASNLF